MSSWTDDTFFIRGEEIKARRKEVGEFTYHAIAYQGAFYALENSRVVTSSLNSISDVEDWIDLNSKNGRKIGMVEYTGTRPLVRPIPVPSGQTRSSDPEPTVHAFTVTHEGKRDFRITYNGELVETCGTNTAAVKRAEKYQTKLDEWLKAGKPVEKFKFKRTVQKET